MSQVIENALYRICFYACFLKLFLEEFSVILAESFVILFTVCRSLRLNICCIVDILGSKRIIHDSSLDDRIHQRIYLRIGYIIDKERRGGGIKVSLLHIIPCIGRHSLLGIAHVDITRKVVIHHVIMIETCYCAV